MERTLTALDRCDTCGAPAYLEVFFAAGSLLFCAHHWVASEKGIMEKAVRLVDEREALYPNKQLEAVVK